MTRSGVCQPARLIGLEAFFQPWFLSNQVLLVAGFQRRLQLQQRQDPDAVQRRLSDLQPQRRRALQPQGETTPLRWRFNLYFNRQNIHNKVQHQTHDTVTDVSLEAEKNNQSFRFGCFLSTFDAANENDSCPKQYMVLETCCMIL